MGDPGKHRNMAKPASNNAVKTPGARISTARSAAFSILLRVETQGSYASELLHGELTGRLDGREAGLCTELVMGCLRWQNQLDSAIQQFSAMRNEKLDAEVRIALRLGGYQLLHLTRIPARAAISESVDLVKRAGKTSASGLVNAVLRKLAQSGAPPGLQCGGDSSAELDAIALGHPAWLLQRWKNRIGGEQAEARCKADNQPPLTYLRATKGTENGVLINSLLNEGVTATPASLLKGCLVLISGNVMNTSAFHRGEVAIQDQASQIVPLLLDARPGHRVLDVCAAPGNKSTELAEAVGREGLVIGADIHLHRLRNWAARPASINRAVIHHVVMDASRPLPLNTSFDRILVDAPCSGTGTLRRNPEIKWRLQPGSLQELAQLQMKLLQQAAAAVSSTGRIVYSTCSMEAEENQRVVESFISANPEFELIPLRSEADRLADYFVDPEASTVKELLGADYLETSPEKHNTDGFFAAILQRVANPAESPRVNAQQ
jgi:16S rRNA (cytosine967-C5)-methyltransferase